MNNIAATANSCVCILYHILDSLEPLKLLNIVTSDLTRSAERVSFSWNSRNFRAEIVVQAHSKWSGLPPRSIGAAV